MRIWKKPAFAVAALVSVVALLALVPQDEATSDDAPATAIESVPPERATFPPPPAAKASPTLQAAEDHGRALCEACLPERAVLDVAKTYLRHLDPVYLQREIRAHPLADVLPDVVPENFELILPELPADLVGAPAKNPFGMSIGYGSYPVDTTWFVWVHTGWVPREAIERRVGLPGETVLGPEEADAVVSGDVSIRELVPGWQPGDHVRIGRLLPDVALSWPPIKEEHDIAVDSRTGDVLDVSGYFVRRARAEDVDSKAHAEALELARVRADQWFRGEVPD